MATMGKLLDRPIVPLWETQCKADLNVSIYLKDILFQKIPFKLFDIEIHTKKIIIIINDKISFLTNKLR